MSVMTQPDPMHEHEDQIATFEAEVESLSDRAERCRKIIILAKLSILTLKGAQMRP